VTVEALLMKRRKGALMHPKGGGVKTGDPGDARETSVLLL
jgi:hypothetical protein